MRPESRVTNAGDGGRGARTTAAAVRAGGPPPRYDPSRSVHRHGREEVPVGPVAVLRWFVLPLLAGCAATGAPDPRPLDRSTLPAVDWAPKGYVCPRAATPPVIDGRLDDAAWRDAPPTDPFQDIEGPVRPAPRFATRARLVWDDRCLYVAAEMEEPDVSATLTRRDAVIFHDNDFEVFLDPDGDALTYFELEINAFGTVWDLYLERAYRDGGSADDGWDVEGLRAAVHVDGTVNDPSDRDRGWTVEMAIPWQAFAANGGRRIPPEPSDRWRVNFSRVQWRYETTAGTYTKVLDPATGKSLPEDNWVWTPQGVIAMHHPEMWGFLQFARTADEPLRAATPAERGPWEALLRRAGPR